MPIGYYPLKGLPLPVFGGAHSIPALVPMLSENHCAGTIFLRNRLFPG